MNEKKIKTINFEETIIPAFSDLYGILKRLKKGELLEIVDYYLWGGRYSGKSYSIYIFIFLLFLLKVDATVYFLRNLKSIVFESVWINIFNYFREYELLDFVDVNITRYTIKSRFGSTVFKARGLHQIKNDVMVFKGIEQMRTKYCFLIEEEANEIQQKDRDALIMGARGKGLKQIIRFFLFNPTHSKQAIVNYCEEKLPFNEALMRTRGWDLKVEKDALFYRTNWRVNPYMKDDSRRKKEFERMWKIAPQQAKCWDLGAVGVIEDAIFASAMKYIGIEPLNRYTFSPKTIFGGLDFGFKQDAFACVLMALSYHDNKIYCLDEFYLNNKTMGLNHQQIAESLIVFLQEQLLEFNYYGNVIITCDSSDFAFIEIMNLQAKRMDEARIYFMPGIKTRVEVGIGIVREIIEKRALVFNFEKMYNLKREMFGLAFKENSATLKLTDSDNHAFDALRYGIYQHLEILNLESNLTRSTYDV